MSTLRYFNLDDITLPPEPARAAAVDEYDPSQPLPVVDEQPAPLPVEPQPVDLDHRQTKVSLQFKPHVMTTRRIIRKAASARKHSKDDADEDDSQSHPTDVAKSEPVVPETTANKLEKVDSVPPVESAKDRVESKIETADKNSKESALKAENTRSKDSSRKDQTSESTKKSSDRKEDRPRRTRSRSRRRSRSVRRNEHSKDRRDSSSIRRDSRRDRDRDVDRVRRERSPERSTKRRERSRSRPRVSGSGAKSKEICRAKDDKSERKREHDHSGKESRKRHKSPVKDHLDRPTETEKIDIIAAENERCDGKTNAGVSEHVTRNENVEVGNNQRLPESEHHRSTFAEINLATEPTNSVELSADFDPHHSNANDSVTLPSPPSVGPPGDSTLEQKPTVSEEVAPQTEKKTPDDVNDPSLPGKEERQEQEQRQISANFVEGSISDENLLNYTLAALLLVDRLETCSVDTKKTQPLVLQLKLLLKKQKSLFFKRSNRAAKASKIRQETSVSLNDSKPSPTNSGPSEANILQQQQMYELLNKKKRRLVSEEVFSKKTRSFPKANEHDEKSPPPPPPPPKLDRKKSSRREANTPPPPPPPCNPSANNTEKPQAVLVPVATYRPVFSTNGCTVTATGSIVAQNGAEMVATLDKVTVEHTSKKHRRL